MLKVIFSLFNKIETKETVSIQFNIYQSCVDMIACGAVTHANQIEEVSGLSDGEKFRLIAMI